MTSRKPIATIRGTAEDKRRLDQLVDQSGLSQQDYLLRVALSGLPSDDSSTHQTPDSKLLSTITSQQETIASQQETIRQLSEQLSKYQVNSIQKPYMENISDDSDIKYQEGVCVSGLEADRVLLVAEQDKPSPYAPKGQPKLALAYDLLWLVVKTPNGNQRRLEAIAEVPKELQDCRSDYDSLSKLHKALDGYQQLVQLDGWELLSPREQQKAIRSCYRAEGCKKSLENLLESTSENIANIKATHTPVDKGDINEEAKKPDALSGCQIETDSTPEESDSKLIVVTSKPESSPILDNPEVTEPTLEPTPSSTQPAPQPSLEGLDRDSFRAKFGLDDNSYNKAAEATKKKSDRWPDPDGNLWRRTGRREKAKWFQVAP